MQTFNTFLIQHQISHFVPHAPMFTGRLSALSDVPCWGVKRLKKFLDDIFCFLAPFFVFFSLLSVWFSRLYVERRCAPDLEVAVGLFSPYFFFFFQKHGFFWKYVLFIYRCADIGGFVFFDSSLVLTDLTRFIWMKHENKRSGLYVASWAGRGQDGLGKFQPWRRLIIVAGMDHHLRARCLVSIFFFAEFDLCKSCKSCELCLKLDQCFD